MSRISLALPRKISTKSWGYGLFGLAIALIMFDVLLRGEAVFNPAGWATLYRFFRAAFHPNLSFDFLAVTLEAGLTTLAYGLCGTFLSVLLGSFGCLLSTPLLWPHKHQWACFLCRGLLAIPRAIHELIWGLVLVNLWGLDPLVALGAIAIPFGAMVAKIFTEILEETPRTSFDALVHSGAPVGQALLYGLLPQAGLNLLSYCFYRFECSLRSATALGIIGAGGLGYEIFLSLQSLRYSDLWTLFYGLMILNGIVGWCSDLVRQQLGCSKPLIQGSQANIPSKENRPQNPLPLWSIAAVTIGAVAWGLCYVQPQWAQLWSRQTPRFFEEIATQWSSFQLQPGQLVTLADLSRQTLEMSILAIAFASIGGFLLALFITTPWSLPLLPGVLLGKLGLLLCRSVPAPIWALVVAFVVLPGILPGAIALGIYNLGILGRLLAEVLENTHQAPLRALENLGSNPNKVWLYGTLPLTLPQFIGYSFYRWEVCLRETVIVGLVCAGGLGRLIMEQLSSFDYLGVGVTLIAFLLLSYAVDRYSAFLRQKP